MSSDYDPLRDELTETFCEIDRLIEAVKQQERKFNPSEPLRDARGHFVMTPLLQAKAQLLTAQAIHNQRSRE